MRYPDTYLINHDIDWFCVVNGIYIHVASAGGMLPNQINDDESLRISQFLVEMLPDIYSNEEIEYNDQAIALAIGGNGDKGREQYIESFTAMARKGFVSFDRTNIGDPYDNRYHMVCRPRGLGRKPQGVDLFTFQTGRAIGEQEIPELTAWVDAFVEPKR